MLLAQKKYFMPHVTSIKLVLASIIFALTVPGSVSAYSPAALSDNEVKKAEKIIAKLNRLEEVAASAVDFRAYKAEFKGLYPGLFADASELREGDLKTDLTTAVFLHEAAYRTSLNSGARKTGCDGEVRETYLKLCRNNQEGKHARLLWSKARLHTNWAEAVVRFYRGASDSETLAELSKIEAARKEDIILAEHAVEALRELARRVGVYASTGAFEEAVRANKISFEQLSKDLSKALSTIDQVLSSMPRGRLYLLLDNARSAYRDGVFWWGKTYRLQGRTVSVNNLVAPDPLKEVGLSASTVSSAVLANWGTALRYTEEAEKALRALKS